MDEPSEVDLGVGLRRYIYEQNPTRAIRRILSEAYVENAETTIRALSAQLYSTHNLSDYSVKSLSNYLADCDAYLGKPKREQSALVIEHRLLDAWKRLECLLKITLLFYGKLFDHFDIAVPTRTHGTTGRQVTSLHEFVRPFCRRALSQVIDCIVVIEEVFGNSQMYRRECWKLCNRGTPFAGWDPLPLRREHEYRNALAHWVSNRVAGEITESEAVFVSSSLDPVRAAARELIDRSLVPTAFFEPKLVPRQELIDDYLRLTVINE